METQEEVFNKKSFSNETSTSRNSSLEGEDDDLPEEENIIGQFIVKTRSKLFEILKKVSFFSDRLSKIWNKLRTISRRQARTALKNKSSLGGLEPPTFRLTAERANRLRHRDLMFGLISFACISNI